jgi:hypothetical protein
MPEIKFVKQKHKYACSIACASMITGEDYDEIMKDFGNNFHKEGIPDDVLLDYLGNKGYSIVQKEITHWGEKDFARKEMLKPFAPVHLVRVKINADSGLLHWIVMTAKGKLICPMEFTESSVRNSYLILKIVGLYK